MSRPAAGRRRTGRPATPQDLRAWNRVVEAGGHAKVAVALAAIVGSGSLRDAWAEDDGEDGWRSHILNQAFTEAVTGDPTVDPAAFGYPMPHEPPVDGARRVAVWSRVVDACAEPLAGLVDVDGLRDAAIIADLDRAGRSGSVADMCAVAKVARAKLPAAWRGGEDADAPWTGEAGAVLDGPAWRSATGEVARRDRVGWGWELLAMSWGLGSPPEPDAATMSGIAAALLAEEGARFRRRAAVDAVGMLDLADASAAPIRSALAHLAGDADVVVGQAVAALATSDLRPGPDRGAILLRRAAAWSVRDPAADGVGILVGMALDEDLRAGPDRSWLAATVRDHGGALLTGPHAMRLLAAASAEATA